MTTSPPPMEMKNDKDGFKHAGFCGFVIVLIVLVMLSVRVTVSAPSISRRKLHCGDPSAPGPAPAARSC